MPHNKKGNNNAYKKLILFSCLLLAIGSCNQKYKVPPKDKKNVTLQKVTSPKLLNVATGKMDGTRHSIVRNEPGGAASGGLKSPPEITTSQPRKNTELHKAVKEKKNSTVKALLEKNSDLLNIQNEDDGATALHLAVYLGKREIVETLLEKKANLSIRDDYGWLPLHIAAWYNHKEIVALLLAEEAGADPNIQDAAYKWTPLHVAAYKGYDEIVKLLLAAEAGPDIQDKDGNTPLDIAKKRGKNSTVKILKKAEEG